MNINDLDLSNAFNLNRKVPVVESVAKYQYASYQYELIMKEIHSFESELDDEHEVGIKLASFGQQILLAVTDIGYANPNLLFFYGNVNGQPATLIQHQSQLSFLLTAIPKEQPDKPPRRIGFEADRDS